MLIAGEVSGDLLAAELVQALRSENAVANPVPTWDYQPLHTSLEPKFFGAGGPQMKAAGVDLTFDMTEHSLIGLSHVIRHYSKFRRFFKQLYDLALERQPDAIICIDFSGFNSRLAHAIKAFTRSHSDWFHDWQPRLIQYVSPQVWASREGRAYRLAQDLDLLLSIIPFEKDWYARRVPELPVEFVGHPLIDRYHKELPSVCSTVHSRSSPVVVLLPGSRSAELERHLPVMLGALSKLRKQIGSLQARMVLPAQSTLDLARAMSLPSDLDVQVGGLADVLAQSDLAIASTGTVTLECALFGIPTIAIYKTSSVNYHIIKPFVKVKYLAMPNLLAKEEIFPEFIQNDATEENIFRASLELLRDERRRAGMKKKLATITASLGGRGESRRAAAAVLRLFSRGFISKDQVAPVTSVSI